MLTFLRGHIEICNTPFSQLKNFIKHLTKYATQQRDITYKLNPKQSNNNLTNILQNIAAEKNAYNS